MQFPESWLREFCDPAMSSQALADALTMAGLEVEDAVPAAPPFTGVLVGEIKACEQHPNADRLRICQVDIGQGNTGVSGTSTLLNIVCGAPNARVGIRVPVATVGALLPPGADGKPFEIKLGQLRGVESQGMLCSAKELVIDEDASGLFELPADAPIGTNIRDYLKLDDTLFTLKLTPNLGHCLSVFGVAREVSAITGAPLKVASFPAVATSHTDKLAVKISAPDLCGRFSGRIVRGVNPQAKTPQWMVDRLARCGQRSVTALVDISNYVMFEYGRPSHIFDLDKIHGGLDVRWGRAGESLTLLNGTTITVDEKVGVIADSQAVESLAGIMGGDSTSVTNDTQNIYIEAAFWWPEAVAGRSRRFSFSTDAGHRFERGVDPSQTVEHIEHITQLVLDICGGQAGPMDDQQVNLPVRKSVQLRVARAQRVIGMPVTAAQCLDAFKRLGLPAVESNGVITVTPPAYRFDINIEEDLIEEVVRLIGFNNLPTTAPIAPVEPKARSEALQSRFAVRRSLAGLGYTETINFSFVEERWERDLAGNANPIKLLNPIASQLNVMRSSLMGSLLQVLKFNLDRKADRVRVFELGRVFMRDASVKSSDTSVDGIHQPMRIAGLAAGSASALQWSGQEQPVDFYDVKGDVQALLAPQQPVFEPSEHPAMHPGRCAKVLLNGVAIGFVGELHPQWRQTFELPSAPMLFELALDAVLQRALPAFTAIAKFQAVQRDIAVLLADHVTHALLLKSIWSAPTQGLLREAKLFDIYRPKSAPEGVMSNTPERSLAVRLTLNGADATLTDAQIESAVQSVIAQLAQDLGARQRS